MQPTPAPASVGLSHSRNSFCGMQGKYQIVDGIRKPENFIFARGHVAEAIVQAHLNNVRTKVNGLSLREAGFAEMEKRGKLMETTELDELHKHFPQILVGAEQYINTIDYDMEDIGHWFTLDIKGFTRPIRGQIDIIGNRGYPCGKNLDVIIDIKYQMKPLTDSKFKRDKKEWHRQLGLYALYYMAANQTFTAPLCEVHVIVANGQPQVFEVQVTEELLYKVLDDQHNLNVRLDAGYWPMAREHRLCDPRWCHVYGVCHEENFLSTPDLIDLVTNIV